jgi:uncharacterized membrane protein
MTTETAAWHWTFPGGLAGLLLALGVGMAIIWFAYRRTLRQLSPGWRGTLVFLRCLMLVLLLLCLASPQLVHSRTQKQSPRKPIAVVVDGSGSMVRPDGGGQTRLEIARRALGRIWDASGRMKLFAFAEKLRPLAAPDALASITDPQRETHLLASLKDVLNAAPPNGWGGVIVFTDGNDTTDANVEETGRLFRERQTPLVLAVPQNTLRQPDLLRLASVGLQSIQTMQTDYPLEVLIRSSLTAPRPVTVRVLQNGQPVKESKLILSPGSHTQKVTFDFIATAVGRQDFQIQLIEDGKITPTDQLFASTQIVERQDLRALYYSGSLSVEYRYVRAAFANNPSIVLESTFHVSASSLRHQVLFGNLSRSSEDASNFPKTADELNQYQVVILADLLPSQLTDQQAQALIDYVKGGGGLIFIVSNSTVASDFSGSRLEQLLPVVFEPAAPAGAAGGDGSAGDQSAAARLLRRLQGLDAESNSPDNSEIAKLVPMEVTPDGRSVFGTLGDQAGEDTPMFREYAAVQRAKPGAMVAAEHPTDADAFGKRPLLAMQRFGEGRSAVLATDSIWRWQLSLPSDSHAYAKLWQQMLLWVVHPGDEAPQIQLGVSSAAVGEKVPITVRLPLRLHHVTTSGVLLSAYLPDGTSQDIDLSPGASPGSFTGSYTPTAGPWVRFQANEIELDKGTAMLNVRSAGQSLEDEHLGIDLPGLQRLAAAAGGQVLEAASLRALPPFTVGEDETVSEEKTRDLWDNSGVLAAVLGLFCVELLLRRWLKLL